MKAKEFLQKELNKGEVFKGASTIDGRFTGTVYLNKLVELIEKYANQSREEGSGKLPLNITIWKKANSLKYPDFAKWFNKRLEK